MTRGYFSIGQSWNFEFHKVKLLKFQRFNFDLWKNDLWSFFHYKQIFLKKSSVSWSKKDKGVASSWEWHAYFS